VVVLPPPEIATAIDALRAALGDRQLTRIPAHITLVPPVNVAAVDVDAVLDVLRSAAKRTRPFGLHLGPPTTFLPDTPTLYLTVDGDLDALDALRTAVFVDPLARPLTWPFVAHLTLLDEAEEPRIRAAIDALANASYDFHVREITLLEEQAGHVWRPIASFPF
jgi:2'-5' RNA ligase